MRLVAATMRWSGMEQARFPQSAVREPGTANLETIFLQPPPCGLSFRMANAHPFPAATRASALRCLTGDDTGLHVLTEPDGFFPLDTVHIVNLVRPQQPKVEEVERALSLKERGLFSL
jgi:hypothetical protein